MLPSRVSGGRAGDVTVHYRNKPYETTGFRAKERGDYIELRLDELSSPDQLEEMLMKGFALELFVQLEKVPSETSGFFTSCNDGGVTLYLRGKRGQMNFQLGSTQGNYSENPHYVMAAGSDLLEGTGIDAKRVAHVLGTYDPEDRMLQLYYNGVLIGQEKFTGQFRLGNAIYNKLGIGCNVSYKEEMLSDFTNYVVLGAKIYTQGLDERQVAKAYYDSLDRIGAVKAAIPTPRQISLPPRTASLLRRGSSACCLSCSVRRRHRSVYSGGDYPQKTDELNRRRRRLSQIRPYSRIAASQLCCPGRTGGFAI